MEIVISGIAETAAALRALPAKIQKRSMRKALRAGAQLTLNAAISLVPRRTGALASSITVAARGDTVSVGPNKGTRDGTDKRKMRNDSIANFQEKGTVNHYNWNGQRITKAEARRKKKNVISVQKIEERMPAHPFMRPAFEATKEQAAQVIVDSLKQDIENQP